MISRTDNLTSILQHNPLMELVLDRFDLTYTQLDQTVEIVCKDKCADIDFFVEILRIFDDPDSFEAANLRQYDLSTILEYLEKTHKYYLDKRLGEIERSIDQLRNNIGRNHSVLGLLAHSFISYKQHLTKHIQQEEEIVFPYIRTLLNNNHENTPTVSLSDFVHDHQEDQLYTCLCEIRQMIIQKEPKLHTWMSFRILNAQLDAFERDLLIHERIEEEVLIPEAIRLSK